MGKDQEKEHEQKAIAYMEILHPTHSIQVTVELLYLPPVTCSLLGAGGFAALFAP